MTRHLAAATLALVAALVAVATGVDAPPTQAQGAPTGTITGELRAPEPVPDLDGSPIEVVAVDAAGAIQTFEGTSAGARFVVPVPADPGLSYLVRAFVHGVGYTAVRPVQVLPNAPFAEVIVEVFGATDEPPELRIVSTTVSLLELDRAAGTMVFGRQDIIVNPTLETYVASEGPSIRLPLPDGTTAAEGAASYLGVPVPSSFVVDGATLNTDAAIRPGETSIVSQFTVGYDLTADAYRLRITPSLPTGGIEVLVPESFLNEIVPSAEGIRAADRIVEGETIASIVSTGPLDPGRSLLIDLNGLSGEKPPSPLTSMPGAAIGLLAALAIIAVGVHLSTGWGARRSAVAVEDAGRA